MLETLRAPRPAGPARAPAPVRGVRIGWIRPRRPAVSRGPWPGDINTGVWFDEAALPAWINGRIARSRLILRLALAEASLLLLGVSYALMALGS